MKLNSYSNFWLKAARAPEGDPPSAPVADPPNPAPTDPTPDSALEAPDLSFIGEDFHTDGKPDIGKFTEHYQNLVADNARQAERAAGVPEDGAYDLALGELDFGDLPLPENFAVQLDLENPAYAPIVGELTGWMKSNGIPQEAASQLVNLLGRYEAARYSQTFDAGRQALNSLGTPAQQQARIGSIRRSLGAALPKQQADALEAAVTSADGIKALEALLSPRGMKTPNPEPTLPDMSNMPPKERLRYINRQQAEGQRN